MCEASIRHLGDIDDQSPQIYSVLIRTTIYYLVISFRILGTRYDGISVFLSVKGEDGAYFVFCIKKINFTFTSLFLTPTTPYF